MSGDETRLTKYSEHHRNSVVNHAVFIHNTIINFFYFVTLFF